MCIVGLESWTFQDNDSFQPLSQSCRKTLLLLTFKNTFCLPQRCSVHFEQVPFQSILTRLSYQHADRRTNGFSALRIYVDGDCNDQPCEYKIITNFLSILYHNLTIYANNTKCLLLVQNLMGFFCNLQKQDTTFTTTDMHQQKFNLVYLILDIILALTNVCECN